MKILMTLIMLLSFQVSHATILLEAGTGSGSVKSEDISASFIQFTYSPAPILKILKGEVGYGVGFRSSFYQADLFQAGPSNTDLLEDISISTHNLLVQVHYIRSNFQVGFNLDIFGVSSSSSNKIKGTDNKIDNETSNLFLGGENDKGSLNSHLFIAYNFTPLVVKAGLAHSVIKFEDTGLPDGETRQRFFDTYALSLGYLF